MNEVINMQGMECPPCAKLGRNSRGSFAGAESAHVHVCGWVCVCDCVEEEPEKESAANRPRRHKGRLCGSSRRVDTDSQQQQRTERLSSGLNCMMLTDMGT